ncbi:MAG: glycosyltransferase family 4 protein [Ignavibacteriae bacterium]|nr:glycosyltransferase WbuB [Ignavibacteriota bacterium]NOG96840.1 glycosyltransferase family 4 protein [Ignavibacteriota bacterium]
MRDFTDKHIVIIIEDMPAPLDRRVWQEAIALKEKGSSVSIICPKMKGYNKSYEVIDGIKIYRHPIPFEAERAVGFLLEYSTALLFEFALLVKIYLKQKINVIQGCTPPDLMFLPVLPFKLFGVKYVFDHHDLNPELYLSKFNKKGFFYQLLKLFEKMNFRTADFSIAMNSSYKNIAIERGKMNPENVSIVRSGPDLERLKICKENMKYKNDKKFLVGYLGVISKQDGVDLLMKIIRLVLDRRDDVQFAIIGGGLELENIKDIAAKLKIKNDVTFYGMVKDNNLLSEIISTCDICVNPDEYNEFNDTCTSVKIMEYMALKKAVVQFDLKEGRYSAQKAALYAENGSLHDFADKICYLLDQKMLREEMAEFGYQRVVKELSWQNEKMKYLNFYSKVFSNRN